MIRGRGKDGEAWRRVECWLLARLAVALRLPFMMRLEKWSQDMGETAYRIQSGSLLGFLTTLAAVQTRVWVNLQMRNET